MPDLVETIRNKNATLNNQSGIFIIILLIKLIG